MSGEEKNYRDVATIMTRDGFQMNHSSVRNYVNRIMYRIIKAYVAKHNIDCKNVDLNKVSQTPLFQRSVADILHMITANTYNKKEDVHVKRNAEEPTKDNA